MTEVLDLPTGGRQQPAKSKDTDFFWEGAREGKLLIQRCTACGELRNPPGPACPSCHSLDWDTTESSGRGTIYSYMVQHHPPAQGFAGPAPAILVELEEGTRLVSNLEGVDADGIEIGREVEVFFLPQDEGWTIPQFRYAT